MAHGSGMLVGTTKLKLQHCCFLPDRSPRAWFGRGRMGVRERPALVAREDWALAVMLSQGVALCLILDLVLADI